MKGKKAVTKAPEASGAFERLVQQKIESRQKREAKKAELLKKMEQQVRKNKFNDKRWGEHNPNISADKKMLMRFTKERMKVKKAKKFDLEDDEEDFVGLTHLGKNIDEMDDFKEEIERSEDDYSDNELAKKADEEFVSKMNFGEGARGGNQGRKKSRKEIFDEIMLKSKLYRAEKAKERMENKELTEKINAQFGDILPLLKKRQKAEEPQDEYDRLRNELQQQ